MTRRLPRPSTATLSSIAGHVRALCSDERGATIVEFAMIAPVMALTLLGTYDMGHTLYMEGALQGIVQKTARDATLEGGSTVAMQTKFDERVKKQVMAISNNGDLKITRRFYRTFSDAAAAKAEIWSDTNKNEVCDAGEPYEDANNNNAWDRDGGNAGQGGAKDAVVYTASISYPRTFPLYGLIGASQKVTVKATTILRNQPFGDQESYGPKTVRNCA
jgi:Flp pilus assembly protein TadG